MTIDERRPHPLVTDLLKLRNRVGRKTVPGHIASGLAEQIRNHETEADPRARAWLEKFMANTTALLAAALAR
jgi:hypothetical protein